MTEEPRAYTADECRKLLLDQLDAIVRDVVHNEQVAGVERKVRLAIFSALVIFDGESGLPAMDIVTAPHPDDEAFRRDQGDDWWPTGVNLADGTLHERWARGYR